MTDYLKILRLNYLDYSQRRIADSARCSRHTIRNVLEVTSKANIHWPLDKDITNAELERILFPDKYQKISTYVETVCLLSKLNVKHHIEVEITMDELDLTAAESKATYDEIKAYVLEKFGFKVSQLYIAQIKRKCGIIERKNYNQSKKEDAKVPKCPPEKEAAIMDALKHFQMIP